MTNVRPGRDSIQVPQSFELQPERMRHQGWPLMMKYLIIIISDQYNNRALIIIKHILYINATLAPFTVHLNMFNQILEP